MPKKKKSAKIIMPKPECEQGYPDAQVRAIMGDRYNEFMRWMTGQTMAICDGSYYDHSSRSKKLSGCGPHDVIVYSWDAQRFLEGRPIID